MTDLFLFTDGSVNTKLKNGFGAYLLVTNLEFPIENIRKLIVVKQFNETSSSKLELQTLLWALSKIPKSTNKIIIFTDSQNIIGLKERRDKLEKNNYSSKKNELIKNHLLYKEFFNLIDTFNCEFIQVKGHKASKQKNRIEQIFTLVDRASRNALRIIGKS